MTQPIKTTRAERATLVDRILAIFNVKPRNARRLVEDALAPEPGKVEPFIACNRCDDPTSCALDGECGLQPEPGKTPEGRALTDWEKGEHFRPPTPETVIEAIQKAMALVERLPADVRLTDAVVLLTEARDAVTDYVNGERLARRTVTHDTWRE